MGEEKIPEMGMEGLANEALDKKIRFPTIHEQVNALLTKKDEAFRQRISFKASFEYEITNFAQSISRNNELVAIERHGEEPDIISLQNEDEEIRTIRALIKDFRQSEYRSLGIICKTWKQAEWLHLKLEDPDEYIYLLSAQSACFAEGVILTTAHMAKGLEFDQVVVPFASAANYKNSIDKSMLYIACTRAMHKLTLTHTGKPSGMLPNH